MPKVIRSYVRYVEGVNWFVGRIAMYLLFVMMAILLWSSISKTFFNPTLWTLEMAQFAMVSYYLLGGPYSLQLGSNVRMDLFYGSWSDRTKAAVDAFTVLFLIFYLCVLFYGAVGSSAYSLGYYGAEPFTFFGDLIGTLFTEGYDAAEKAIKRVERSSTAWRPVMWPIKAVMCLAVFLMLLQATAILFKDIAKLRGEEL